MYTKPILIDLPEAIETSRLILHAPKAGLGQGLYEAMIDGYDDYIKWLNWSPTQPTPQEVEIQCRHHHAEFILRDYIRYIIIEKATNRVVGRCAFPPPHVLWSVPQFGISYFIRHSARNQGYATEAAHALTLMAFQIFEAKKIEIYCDAENIASQKIPQKLGFILETTKKGGWPRPDKQLAVLLNFSIFSSKSLPNWPVKY